MKSKIIASTLLGIGFLIGASALSALAVWTGAPAGGPTNCPTNLAPTDPGYIEGCFAPINVGTKLQEKLGTLGTLGLSVLGDFKFLPVGGAQPTAGQVLTADSSDLVNGKVKWENVSQNVCSMATGLDIGILTGTSGNNTKYIRRIGTLSPGTYSFFGSGTSNNGGGGGINAVFLSSTLYLDGVISNYPIEVSGYYGSTTGAPDEVSYDIGNSIVYAVKRYGSFATTVWTIPAKLAVKVSSRKYMYVILGQATATGQINVSTMFDCTNIPTI